MILNLNKTYLIFTILLFSIEILIAAYLKTGFIRYTFGDFLSVILLYCFFRSFLKVKPVKLAVFVLAIAFFIEFMQLLNILEWLQLEQNEILKIILGSTFNTLDLVAYTLGIATVLIIEYLNTTYHELH